MKNFLTPNPKISNGCEIEELKKCNKLYAIFPYLLKINHEKISMKAQIKWIIMQNTTVKFFKSLMYYLLNILALNDI